MSELDRMASANHLAKPEAATSCLAARRLSGKTIITCWPLSFPGDSPATNALNQKDQA